MRSGKITPFSFPFELPFLVMSQETQTPVLAPAAASTAPAPGTVAAPAAPAAPGTALPPLQRLCESESTATPGELDLLDVGRS